MKKKARKPVRKNTSNRPELYTENEIDALEAHITMRFGNFESVFHEIASPDIHADIAIIPPTAERDYNVLVTMGMGAHRMNVPKQLSERGLERAEMLICLPPDWRFDSGEEQWYWPVRWLKIMARLPIENNTWLGWGHTVPNGEPFAGNTKLSGMIVVSPDMFGEEAQVCEMPDGSRVIFYQLIPLYDEEMNFKLQNGAEALFDKLNRETAAVLDIRRPNAIL